jgi:hypothetical protein
MWWNCGHFANQHRIVAPPKAQMPDAPARQDERRPELIMGAGQTEYLQHSLL